MVIYYSVIYLQLYVLRFQKWRNLGNESIMTMTFIFLQLIVNFSVGWVKSDCQEKSTKILISWKELKNQFLSFFVYG